MTKVADKFRKFSKNREMKFGTSEGMILASSNEEGVFLIGSDSGAKPGDKVT